MKKIIALLKKLGTARQDYPAALQAKRRTEFIETMRKFGKRRS